jgi:hypothetical protein
MGCGKMREWVTRRRWRAALIGCLMATVLSGVIALSGTPSSAVAATSLCGGIVTMTDRVPLPGHLVPVLQGMTPLRPMDCNAVLRLTISLKPRNPDELNRFIQDVNTPGSPDYGKFLTVQQYADRFGQPQAVIDAVAAFLRVAGFNVTSIAPNRLSISATATVAQIEQAFGVQIGVFNFMGRIVHAPLNEPSAPAALAPAIQAVIGLSDVAVAHRPR